MTAAKTKSPAPSAAAEAVEPTPVVLVMRLPGSPPRRAGRAWEAGQEVVCMLGEDLTAEQLAELEADPGYHVTRLDGAPVGSDGAPPDDATDD